MPTVIGVTVTDSGVDVRYNESAVGDLVGGVTAGSDDNEQEPSPATPEATQSDQTDDLIHEQINEVRTGRGRSPLDRSPKLDDVAQHHSDDMAENDYFSHTSPTGESLSDRYSQFGIGCQGGENIFKYRASFGVGPETVANRAVESWMGSPGHRENILRVRFSSEGIGVTYAGDTVYVTQNFC